MIQRDGGDHQRHRALRFIGWHCRVPLSIDRLSRVTVPADLACRGAYGDDRRRRRTGPCHGPSGSADAPTPQHSPEADYDHALVLAMRGWLHDTATRDAVRTEILFSTLRARHWSKLRRAR